LADYGQPSAAHHVCVTEALGTTVDHRDRAIMRVQIVFGVLCACVMAAIDSSTSNAEFSQFLQVKADDGCAVCGMSQPNRTLKNIQHRVHCVSSCNHGCPSRCQAVNYWKTAKLCQLFYYEPCSYDTQDGCVIYRVTITELLIHFNCL